VENPRKSIAKRRLPGSVYCLIAVGTLSACTPGLATKGRLDGSGTVTWESESESKVEEEPLGPLPLHALPPLY
jgi:hypothetical protein